MKGVDISKIYYVKNASLQTVIEDGIKSVDEEQDDSIDGFDYKVGELENHDIVVSLRTRKAASDLIEIVGVNGFGFVMVMQK